MARIEIEDFEESRHPNPMGYFDAIQRKRHLRAPRLIPYKVCTITVCGFTFYFHSTEQIRLCLEYYDRRIHPSSRLPVYRENLGGDHWETQRWFDRLPQYLLEKSNRPIVISALRKGLHEYSLVRGASTGAVMKPYFETY